MSLSCIGLDGTAAAVWSLAHPGLLWEPTPRGLHDEGFSCHMGVVVWQSRTAVSASASETALGTAAATMSKDTVRSESHAHLLKTV